MFDHGQRYTRRQIHNAVRGSLQAMLPTAGGAVVCCCLKQEMNLLFAEGKLLIGDFPTKRPAAEQWGQTKQSIPLFLKRGPGQWEYLGQYRATGYSDDPAEVSRLSAQGRDPATRLVLYVEPVRS